MKRRLIFIVLVIFAILAQIGFYYMLLLLGLKYQSGPLFFLTILSGVAFWYLPYWYIFVYSKKLPPPGPDIQS